MSAPSGRRLSTASLPGRMLAALLAFGLAVTGLTFLGAGASTAADSVSVPSIASDQADYPPGALVTLTGAGWQAGEPVHVTVNDDVGRTWQRDVDLTADDAGTVTDSFNLPDWFVATYAVVATGAASGVANASFTDGSVTVTSYPVQTGTNEVKFDMTVDSFEGTGQNPNTTCSGTASGSSTVVVGSVTGTSGDTFSGGAARNKSVRLTAKDTANQPSGWRFVRWESSDGTLRTLDHATCVSGDLGGVTSLRAVYKSVNQAPTLTSVAISPKPAGTDAKLTATPSGYADGDGDPASYHYQWYKGTSALDGATSATLDLAVGGNGDRGDVISVQVYATDGKGGTSPTRSDSLTVANTAPVMDSAAIDETAPRTDTTLHLTKASHDADGDTVAYSYRWQQSTGSGWSDLAGETGPTLDLSKAGNGNRGDQLRAIVTPNDSTDSGAAMTSAAVTVGNTAPTAVDDTAATDEDTSVYVDVLSNDSDLDSDSLAVKGSSLTATHGTAVLVTAVDDPHRGWVRFTPAADYNGTATVAYVATDGSSDSNQATVSVTVNPVNDAPVAHADSYTTPEDTAVAPTADEGVLANDGDVDGDPLSATLVDGPGHGTLTLHADGTFTYTPAGNFNGSDSFTYQVSDGSADSNVATVSLTVTAVNDAPVAVGDHYSTNEDTELVVATSVVGNDQDVDGDPLSPTLVDGPKNGTLTWHEDGTFAYTPAGDFNGSDSFTYQVSDGSANSNVATVSLTVTAVNDKPVADPDSATVAEDGSVLVDVLDGDLAGPANEWTQSLTISSFPSLPENGSVSVESGKVSYRPGADFNGEDSFSYRVCDDGTTAGLPDPLCDTATVSIRVTEVNDAPVAEDDSASVAEDGSVLVDVLAGDVAGPANESGQNLTVDSVTTAPGHGSATVVSGQVRYTPVADYFGPDAFSYRVCDNGTTAGVATPLCDTATVSVTVTEVNDAPTAHADSATVAEDSGASTVAVLGNDSAGPANESDQHLTVDSVTQPAHGTVTVGNAGANVSYTPAADYNGTDSFTYRVCDDGTTAGYAAPLCDTATVSVRVTEVNDAPTVTAGQDQAVDEGSTATVDATFSDVEAGQSYSYSISWGDGSSDSTGTASGGTVSASHTYADNKAGNAAYAAVVTVTDNGTTNGSPDPKSGTATVPVTVRNVAPVVTSLSLDNLDPVTGAARLNASFTDPGADTWTRGFTLSYSGMPVTVGTMTVSADGHSFSAPVTLPRGCYTYALGATVVDDDLATGADSKTVSSTDVYAVAIKAPFKDYERNVVKYGNVVPVKVGITSSCTGASVTTPALYVQLVQGNMVDDSVDATPVVITESVSSADTGNQMRVADGGYIYNLATKPLTAGTDYTVRIRYGSSTGPIVAKALIQPKKQ